MDISQYKNATDTADHLGVSKQVVYNLNSQPNDFPKPVYVGRTPMWHVPDLDLWRARHPRRMSRGKP